MKNRVSHEPHSEPLWERIPAYTKILCPAALALLVLAAGIGSTSAADLTWDNGAGTGNWNTTDANWTGLIWNNSAPDNAVFTTTGGDVTLTESIRAGSITFGSTAANCPNASFNGGSLQANSLTVQGNAGNGPSKTVNRLNLNGMTVSVSGDVAVGRGVLAFADGTLAANRIGTAPASADWATVIISGGTVTATNGVDCKANTSAGTFAMDLDGGTLRTPFMKVADWADMGFVKWNGGTVVAMASTNDFIQLISGTKVYIYDGGSIIDTAGHDIE
ncbi:MAG: hypothetical protein NT154_14610, partial [Verrucomicrobia bacterium]|nr:hypothetical protein [Verrucomicrobiota bacterium]